MSVRRGSIAAVAAMMAFVAGSVASMAPAMAQSKDVVVFAAASLKNALDEASAAWSKDSGKKTAISYAGSDALAKQIESGAPADVYISADPDWMTYLANKNLIKAATRADLLGNQIVLVAAKDSKIGPQTLASGLNLAPLLAGGRLSMANVDSVPAGKYGKASLQSLGAWDAISANIVQSDNVRSALIFVARGEAPLGIVYQTDAAAEPNVKIVGTFPANSHPPIIYPIAIVASSTNADAAAFVSYLQSAAAKPFFEKQGFTVLNKGSS